MMPSIDFSTLAPAFAVGPGGTVGGGVGAISAARFSGAPNSFPPEVAASSVIQMSASGRRVFNSSRICGQKLRSLTAVMSGVATLSNAVIRFFRLIKLALRHVHAVVLLLHCLRSLLRDVGGPRVVSRPTQQREKNTCCRRDEEWPALFQLLSLNDAGRKQIQLNWADSHAAQRQTHQFAKQMRRTRRLWRRRRHGHFLKWIKKLDRHTQTFRGRTRTFWGCLRRRHKGRCAPVVYPVAGHDNE